jgi:uncharacterized protein (TIGR00661 family)
MGTIYFSMSGEGRGHATRVRSMVEELRGRHRVVLFCPGDAFKLLEPVYRGSEVRVIPMPGLRFFYKPNKKLDFVETGRQALQFLMRMPGRVKRLARMVRKHKPDVVVTDFEPLLPRAARRCGIPFLSVNHQHFLIVNDLSALEWRLRLASWLMSWVVWAYYSGQAETVISQFYFPPVRPEYRGRVTMAGVLMRPDILEATPTEGPHLLVYLRKFASDELIGTLKQCGHPVLIYGLGEKPTDGNLRYCPIDDRQFLADLSSCKALVTTAGNQLVGEALFLRKPVLAMPEANNHEQYINAHYLKESGGGEWCELDGLTPEILSRFLSRVPEYRKRINPEKMNGNKIVVETIERYVQK